MTEDEKLEVAIVLAAAIAAAEGFPEDEVALTVPETIFFCYSLAVVGAVEILAAAFQLAYTGNIGADTYFTSDKLVNTRKI